MTLTLAFKVPLPPTLNEQIDLARGGWQMSAKYKKEWTNELAAIAASQIPAYIIHRPVFQGQIWVNMLWQVNHFGNDQDNVSAASKYLFDGLVLADVIPNDNLTVIQAPVTHWYGRVKRRSPQPQANPNPKKRKRKVLLPDEVATTTTKRVSVVISESMDFTVQLMLDKYEKTYNKPFGT